MLDTVTDFLIELGMKPCMHILKISIFSLSKYCHRQTYKNHEQPPQTSQNSDFQSHFSVLKIDRIFPKKFSMKNIGLGDKVLIKNIFENFYF